MTNQSGASLIFSLHLSILSAEKKKHSNASISIPSWVVEVSDGALEVGVPIPYARMLGGLHSLAGISIHSHLKCTSGCNISLEPISGSLHSHLSLSHTPQTNYIEDKVCIFTLFLSSGTN
jgi:hypothetical protein